MSSGNRLKLLLARGGVPVPPAPILMNFGTKTRSGAGEVTTGASASSSPTGTNAADWTVNTRSGMTPSGTYGNFKTYAAGSYTLGIDTGQSVQITMQSAKAHVIAVNSGSNTDSSSSSQIKTVFELGSGASGALVAGDSIVGRTSHFNPSAGLWAIDVPTGAWGASTGNPVIITSESVNSGTDADGNPIRGGGFQIGRMYLGGITGTHPFSCRDMSFYINKAVVANTPLVVWAVAGTGAAFVRCDFRFGASSTNANSSFGINARLPCTVTDCHFENVATALFGDNGAGFQASGNVFKSLYSDAFQTAGNSHNITDNFMYDWAPQVGDHPDTYQLQRTAAVTNRGNFLRNISVRNNGALNLSDAQGLFDDSNGTGFHESGLVFKNNIHFLTATNQAVLDLCDGPVVQYNTMVVDPYANTTISPSNMYTVGAGVGITMTHNVTNLLSTTSQTGTVTNTPNALFSIASSPTAPQKAAYIAALTVAFPNFATFVPGSLKTRAAVLTLFTPANTLVASGGVMNPDGTANGALFPAVSPATIGAWNDGSVYDPGNPTWVSAHPPAS